MSLKLSNFSQYLQISDEIDYIECRLGEQYVILFTFNEGSPPQPIDLTNWTFTIDSEVYSAEFQYNSVGDLTGVKDFVSVGPKRTVSGLAVTVTAPLLGQGTITIPSSVNPNPTDLIWPDTANTMLNIITITMTYPSSVVGFSNIRKSLLGLIVRIGS
jgi:hypothetical protein